MDSIKVLTDEDGEDDMKEFMEDLFELDDHNERKGKILIIGSDS